MTLGGQQKQQISSKVIGIVKIEIVDRRIKTN